MWLTLLLVATCSTVSALVAHRLTRSRYRKGLAAACKINEALQYEVAKQRRQLFSWRNAREV